MADFLISFDAGNEAHEVAFASGTPGTAGIEIQVDEGDFASKLDIANAIRRMLDEYVKSNTPYPWA
jgi:hypothetical protein